MAINNDLKHRTALNAINALERLGIDSTAAHEPLEQWERVRNVRDTHKPDADALWAAVASGDSKKIKTAATEYNVNATLIQAAKDDTRREDKFQAETLSIVKRLVIDAQDIARDEFNAAAEDYTEAFHAADNRPDPSQLIVTDNGAEIWADLLKAAKDMDVALDVLRLAHDFGVKPNDQGTGLIAYLPYAANIPKANAITYAEDTDWLRGKEHSAHRRYAAVLLAGANLHAGTITEQEAEVERIITEYDANQKTSTVPDLRAKEQRRLERAAAKAMRKEQA